MGSNPLLGCSRFFISFCFFHSGYLAFIRLWTFSSNCFYSSRKGLKLPRSPTLPAKHQMISAQRDENIQYPAEPVCVNGSQGNIQRVMSFCCCVFFFFCNRLWNGSWHCFSCDIVAWIGTTGLWDSSLTSVQQHSFLLSSAKFYELYHPISEKTQCADIGSKSD